MFEFFNLCYEQNITVDDDYLKEFVAFTEMFGADFSPNGMFWSKVKDAYESWYKNANPISYNEFGLKGFATEMRTGLPFLIAQMKKDTNLQAPTYTPNNGFTVNQKDLWND